MPIPFLASLMFEVSTEVLYTEDEPDKVPNVWISLVYCDMCIPLTKCDNPALCTVD